MIVAVDADGGVRLLQAEDLRRFSIGLADTDAARGVLASLARSDGPDHAWIAPSAVRALAEQAGVASAGWDEQFAAMVAYAADKGWTDADEALRAHIVHDDASTRQEREREERIG